MMPAPMAWTCGPPWSAVPFESVAELVARSCARVPTQPAMIFEDGLVVTRQELLERIERFAGYLAKRTMPGDRIAVMLETRAETMIALMAALAIGRIFVPIDPAAKEHDAGHVLNDSGAVLAIVSAAQRSLMAALKRRSPALKDILVIRGNEPDGLAAYGASLQPVRLADCRARRQDVATIHYTSGTTGLPKGCMLSHEWWLRLCDVHLRMTPHRPDDRLLCCIPFHYTDSVFQLLCALHAADALIVMRRFSVSRFWQVVCDFGATQLYLIASMPVLLLKGRSAGERSHRVRAVVCAGVPANLHRELHERFGVPFVDTYGSVEAGWVTRMPAAQAEAWTGSGSIGVAAPEVELAIVGEDGRQVSAGQAGELLVRAPGLFAGYLNRPDATEDALRGGWYRTGDVVRVDEQGFCYFLGRTKDIVRRGGENIAASEIESVLRAHPRIHEAAVIPVPDEIRGEEVKACVQLSPGCSPEELPPEEIVAYCGERLAPFKVPRYIEYRTADFPRTPTMRVRKEELKAAPDLTGNAWDRERGGWVHVARSGS
jgi:crotonobetaine/carnitine-CoA ligase